MHKKYGDVFEFYIFKKRIIMLNRADLAENNVLKQSIKSNYFVRALSRSQGWRELGLTERGIVLNAKFKTWSLNRRFLSHCLGATKYIREIFNVAHNRFLEAEQYLKKVDDNTPLEFSKWFHCLTVDTKIEITTGEKTYALAAYANSLLPPHLQKPVPESSIQSYSEFISSLLYRTSVGRYFTRTPAFLRHHVPGFKHIAERMKKKVAWLDEEVKKLVRKKKELIASMDDKEELKMDLLTLMLTTNTERDTNKVKAREFEEPLDESEIASILIEVFSGGVGTITTALCFTVYYICKHPAVKSRLVSEIDATLSADDNTLTYDSLTTLFPYTSAVMKEAARILTIVPLAVQIASEDDEVAGYKWRAGTTIGVNIGVIHKHEAHWKDPETFRPERFLDEGGDEIQPRTFLPFGGTVRVCPGRVVADKLMKTFLILLFSKFEVELCEPDKELEYAYTLANNCKELKVYLKARITEQNV
ncbi:8897_t:CDS:2 [Paraglomus occultum]|uniref:8897_t:CDS:1 n=1 Tax=Paraglomus occultum TaxID=144539 RepID=A0A9N9GDE4_9GLOM|nr:8897_t:CDS:2 [Paraglomus occultum]